MNIGEKLKTARQQSHLTQEAVADLILVSKPSLIGKMKNLTQTLSI